MKIEKLGQLLQPQKSASWNQLYCIAPTPFLEGDQIRIYYGTTDERRRGSIAYVDYDLDLNPLFLSSGPILGPGEGFRTNGVNPTCCLSRGEEKELFFFGYSQSAQGKDQMFAGKVTQDEKGQWGEPIQILHPTPSEPDQRSAPCVVRLEGGEGYRLYYVGGRGWETIEGELFGGREMPTYVIRSAVSEDLIHWEEEEGVRLDLEGDEFGLGRPFVFQFPEELTERYGRWGMLFSQRQRHLSYRLGLALSEDGLSWRRTDFPIEPSASGWDSEMICYGSLLFVGGGAFLFYNGNAHGRDGFGCAKVTF